MDQRLTECLQRTGHKSTALPPIFNNLTRLLQYFFICWHSLHSSTLNLCFKGSNLQSQNSGGAGPELWLWNRNSKTGGGHLSGIFGRCYFICNCGMQSYGTTNQKLRQNCSVAQGYTGKHTDFPVDYLVWRNIGSVKVKASGFSLAGHTLLALTAQFDTRLHNRNSY